MIQYLFTRADTYDAQLVLRWLAGSVSGADWEAIRMLGVCLVLLLPATVLACRGLPVLELGPDLATALGLPRRRGDLALVTADTMTVLIRRVTRLRSTPVSISVDTVRSPSTGALNPFFGFSFSVSF